VRLTHYRNQYYNHRWNWHNLIHDNLMYSQVYTVFL
jgi:hypothetical protein